MVVYTTDVKINAFAVQAALQEANKVPKEVKPCLGVHAHNNVSFDTTLPEKSSDNPSHRLGA